MKQEGIETIKAIIRVQGPVEIATFDEEAAGEKVVVIRKHINHVLN